MTNYDHWYGLHALDNQNDKLGTIEGVYFESDESQVAKWVAIKSGLFGNKMRFAPAEGFREEGDDIILNVNKDQVKDAPEVNDHEEVSVEEEAALHKYYFGTNNNTRTEHAEGQKVDETINEHPADRADGRPDTDNKLRETGRLKLRKRIVTENRPCFEGRSVRRTRTFQHRCVI